MNDKQRGQGEELLSQAIVPLRQTWLQSVVETTVYECLNIILLSSRVRLQEAVWFLSNITAGNQSQVQVCFA